MPRKESAKATLEQVRQILRDGIYHDPVWFNNSMATAVITDLLHIEPNRPECRITKLYKEAKAEERAGLSP